MAFDGIVTRAVTGELNQTILLGKIEKVYQPEPDELVFHIHTRNGNKKLYASAGSSHARIHFITENLTNPQTPMAFCMLLRKHLQGGRIVSIEQRDTERIIEISLETVNELGFSVNKKLIFEIMGKHSNIILTDATSGKIIDSIKRVSIDINRARQILPGKLYEYPPSQGKIPFTHISEEQMRTLCQNQDAADADHLSRILLDHIQGISPSVSRQLAQATDPYACLMEIRNRLENSAFYPVVYRKENNTPVEFHISPLDDFEQYCEKCCFSSVSEAIDYYFTHKSTSNRLKQKSVDLTKAIKNHLNKAYLKKQRLSEDLLKAENSEDYRLFGELLTANMHQIEAGTDSVTVLNYYDGQEITIPLDPRYSPARNAQQYFKKYGKSKTAVKEKAKQLKETDQDIAYLESVAAFIDSASTIEDLDTLREELAVSGFLKKRKTVSGQKKGKAKPFQYTTSDGFRLLVGRNNVDNDRLTFQTAGNKDIWFHTKDIPGSHLILFTEGRELTETAIFEAASIAAFHSKGKTSENVPVDYTQVRYVKKPSGAKPGMVIFTHNKTVYVTPKAPEPTESSSR